MYVCMYARTYVCMYVFKHLSPVDQRNQFVTYLHKVGAVTRFMVRRLSEAGFDTRFVTRFGLPVRTNVLKTMVRAAGRYITFDGASTTRFGYVGQRG